MTEITRITNPISVPEYTKRAIKKYHEKNYYNNEEYKTNMIKRSKDYYEQNKDIMKIKRRYDYWSKINEIERYKIKYPDDISKLCEIGYIQIK